MPIIDTGDYLAEFGENLEAYLKDNLAAIAFEGREPDVRHEFPRVEDVAPCVRIVVPSGSRDFQDGVPVLRIRARLVFSCQGVRDLAKKAESWGLKIATLACGDRVDQRNYWQTDGYMLRVQYQDVDIFQVAETSGAIEADGVVELTADKAL